MNKPRLFITRELLPDIIKRLARYYDIEVWERHQPPPYEVVNEKAKSVNALITLLTDRVDCNLVQQTKSLRIVAQMSTGYGNIDVECATRHGVYVTNTPGVLTEATAELTWALILAAARRMVDEDHFVRWGEWERTKTPWHPLMMIGVELKGKVLGIIGAGRIGIRVAEIGVKGFGMKVIHYNRSRNEYLEKELGAEYRNLDEPLREADIVTIRVSLTPETRHVIGEKQLRRKTALFINTSRGAVVDMRALVKALKKGWIASAGLDVFEEEPLPANHSLTAFKNVVLTPHAGSVTYETRHAMAEIVAENLVALYEGKVPPTLVNKNVADMKPPGFCN